VIFDLLQHSRLMRDHAGLGKIIFGVNHKFRDHQTGREKTLDLVIARPSSTPTRSPRSLADLGDAYHVVLDPAQRSKLATLPDLFEGPVGAVLVALEAKAAMTAHYKALPRLYDELNSSHATVHGAASQAIAVGLAVVNAASRFLSPDRNKAPSAPLDWSTHHQPEDAEATIRKIREIPRRSGYPGHGFDGLGVVVVDFPNDGTTPVRLLTAPPAPKVGDVLHYDTMLTRVATQYDATFGGI
jgi:hypothetical protein